MGENLQTVLIVILFGLIFGGIGVGLILRHKKLVKICTATVAGIVESIERKVSREEDSDGNRSKSVTYAPTFKYVAGGSEYIKMSNESRAHLKLKTGDSVTVFYNPTNPDQYYVKEYKTGRSLGVIFAVVGVVVIVLGIYLAVTGGA